MRALHTAATGMMAQELNVQVISNNIANMRTTGYKKQRAEFQDLLYEQVKRGEGFFKVMLPDGRTSYTRDGSFELDSQGRLVTSQGYLLQPGITIPQNSSGITINAQGQVSVTPAGSTTPTQVGQLELALFVNKAGLQSMGDNLYLETPASGTPQNGLAGQAGFGDMLQGNLEQANVEAVSEISDLIAAQRAYEMNAKVISATDQMLQSTSQMLR
jgi:flagellar basal-body rod protein FlgG